MASGLTTPSSYSPPGSPRPGASSLPSLPRNATALGSMLPVVLVAAAFAILFAQPFKLLAGDWWNRPEAGHGLLLAPVAVWLAWRAGIRGDATGARILGLAILAFAVLIRYASGLAAELFMMRGSMILALIGLATYYWGSRQVVHWWLPFVLLCLSIPLPELVTQAIALPLQFKASQMGAALLEMRQVPVLLTGNVIRLPGQELFVTEACSGLRSLTALISMAVLFGALTLRSVPGRLALLVIAVLVAVMVNGIRVFLTGFLVFFVSPQLGAGFMHTTEGWLLFLVSLAVLAVATWLVGIGERSVRNWRTAHA